MGNPVTVKPAGEFMDRAAIGELDESLGSRLMLPRSSLGTVATGTSYAMLAFGVYSTVRQGMAVQRNQPIIVEGAMVFKDADGAFVVNEPTWMGRVFRNKPQKEYISGPLFDLLNHGEKKRQHIVVPLDNTEYEQLQKEHEERYQFDLDRLKLQRLMPGQAGVPIG